MLSRIKAKRVEIENLKDHISYKNNKFQETINSKLCKELKIINDKLNKSNYKGIIVYPEAIMWEPVQRIHHFLRKLGGSGYICFFCEYNDKETYIVKEMYPNVYLINKEENLLPLLKNREVIFYITYFLQYNYAKMIDNRIIWLDIVDRLDFFSSYNSYSKKVWKEIIKKADIITYTARNFKRYLKKRPDSILLPNAANEEDFIISKKIIPEDMEEIVAIKKPIIGYFGAIEEWFDIEIIKKISETNKYEIVLIGCNNCSQLGQIEHVHLLGPKPFKELKNYACHFSVAIIPFVVNDLTNDVSPVKFFEYMALGLPVISSKMYEMTFYDSKVLKLIDSPDDVEKVINELLLLNKKELKQETKRILEENTWGKRIASIETKIREVKR